MTKEIIYFGDPMCSWCWGFSPVINAINDTYNDEAPLSIILGGLHAYDDFPMSDAYKADIRHHWEDVNKATGAIFDYAFFDREGFVLNTEPACRAVVTARTMNPLGLLDFYESISRSFYSQNMDTTSLDTFKTLAQEAGLDIGQFTDLFLSPDIKESTKNDFTVAKQIGVTGFPTLVVKEDDRLALLSGGYQSFENLQPAIEDWLSNGLQEIPKE